MATQDDPRPPVPDGPDDEVASLWATFSRLPLATVLIDPDTRVARCNDAARELFGFGEDRLDSLDVLFERAESDGTELSADLEAAAERGHVPCTRRRTCRRLDGSTFTGELCVYGIFGGAGVIAVVLHLRDVTEEAEEELAMLRSLARHRALIERGHEAVVILNEAARPVWFSPGAERMLGFRVQDRHDAEHFSLIYEPDREGALVAVANAMHGDGPFAPFHVRVVRADGAVRFLEANASNLLDDPDVAGIVLNIRDITDEPDARSALEIAESRYRKMLENISDTVTLIDAAGAVIASTGNLKSILGYPEDFWRERNAFDLVHPDDADQARRQMVQVLEHPGESVSSEFRVRHAEGHYEVAEVTGVNLLEVPDVRGIVLTTRNVTARRAVEQELAATRDAAIDALAQRTEFVASVSHELRTPIHGVLGLSELLLDADLDPDATSLVQAIVRATESLQVVLDDILDLAKIEAGRIDLHVQPVRLDDVVHDLLALFGPQAAARGLVLGYEPGEGLPARLVTDGFRLRQVLTNLIGNAVKFTTEGSVLLEVTRVPGADGTTERLHFAVRDTGIGIEPDALELIFEPFTQAEATAGTGSGGTGLGLAIARQLVALMGGRLSVASRPDEGSTFSFDLPLVAGMNEPGRSTSTSRHEVPEGARILVVEDNAVNQLLVRRQLERLGCVPTVVADGPAALAALAVDDFDAVLMDRQLPGMDGLAVARELRAREARHRSRHLPVIAMTASAMPGDRSRCLEAGMDDFLAKPVSLSGLARAVAAAMASSVPAGRLTFTSRPARSDASSSAVDADGPNAGMGLQASAVSMGVVDVSVLDRLAEELDDPPTLANVLRSYLRELRSRLDVLEDALRTGDVTTMQRVAHTLSSTSAAVGAVGMRDAARSIEELCRSSAALTPLGASMVQMRAGAATVTEKLESEIVRLGPIHEPRPTG